MFLIIRRRSAYIFSCLAVFFALFSLTVSRGGGEIGVFSPDTAGPEQEMTVVIDAGHGGADGGAVASDGTAEAGINLAVALEMREILALLGVETVLTRESDVSLHSEGADTLREQKVSDIHNRAATVNAVENAVLVSIHQNALPQAKSVRGAQVFFNTQPGSEELAQLLQEGFNRAVNERAKEHKAIDPSVYLMRHAACPAVLVECGFLSNEWETEQLKQPSYQKRLALIIASGILQYRSER